MPPLLVRLGSVLVVVGALAACSPSGGDAARSTVSSAATTPAPVARTPQTTTSPAGTTTITVTPPVDGGDPVAAAVGFLKLTERVTSMTADEAAAAQASISADGARDALVAKTRDEIQRTVAAYDRGTIHVHIAPLATRRTDTGNGVTVAVWYLGVVTVDHGAATSYFRTATYALVREHDAWRMTSLDSTPGPTPMPDKNAYMDSAEQLAGALDGFTPIDRSTP